MNRFTNKNGGILPFQMVKLAANPVKGAVDDAWNAATQWFRHADGAPGPSYSFSGSGLDALSRRPSINNGNNINVNVSATGGKVGKGGKQPRADVTWDTKKKYLNNIDQHVGEVGQQVSEGFTDVKKLLDGVASTGDVVGAAKVLNHNITNLGTQLQKAIAAKDEKLIAQLTGQMGELLKGQQELAAQFPKYAEEILRGQAALSKQIPGFGKLMAASAAGGAAVSGVGAGVSHFANRDANNAHAAGDAAAKEGELAAQQNGQGGGWWDRTWNDINKFREENPGLFYGGLGVGLLGGGYALSEMLDDDDEEDEYRRY